MIVVRTVSSFAFLLLSISLSVAHDPGTNPGMPRHGGQYTEYQTHFGIELVATQERLVFHMTEHLQPKDMTGSNFKVFVQSKSTLKTYEAVAEGATLFVSQPPPPKGAKIILTGKDADEQIIQAQFVLE